MGEKKYYSLYLNIKNKILSGEYRAGEKLPSKRVTSDMTGYSIITVEAAYNMLADEGYVISVERSGYFVCRTEEMDGASKVKGIEKVEHIEDEPWSGTNDFECSVWFKTLRRVIADGGDELFAKAPGKGCAVLRNAIADYLLRYRGMTAQPSNIIIGSGAEQLYETVVKLFGRDKLYGIEEPSYSQIRAVYEGTGASVCGLKMGSDGILSEELEKCELDVLHVTPFHSYPSGATASISKRYEYLAWAKRTGGYIVEDDFDSEFFIPGQPVESLYSLADGERIIYINTFSKSLSPSMRMGYMILSGELTAEYDRRLSYMSCTVPVLEQYVLAEFINNGSFERHLNRSRRKIKLK